MNDRVLRILEYNKIIDMLCERCSGAAGRNISSGLMPFNSRKEAEAAKKEPAKKPAAKKAPAKKPAAKKAPVKADEKKPEEKEKKD